MMAIIQRRLILRGLAVCLLITGGRAVTSAQDAVQPDAPAEPLAEPPAPMVLPAHPLATAPFRDTEYGHLPHYGNEDSPGRGYAHYDYPSQRYGQWYRPKVFGLTQTERCLPRPFRPRGQGNVQNRPSTCYRIDYNPFVLEDPTTEYGPSYFLRQPDGRCGGDELISIGNDVPWYRFNVFHQIHRVGSSMKSMLKF